MSKRRRFYLVAEEILPEAMLKTIQVKEMIARGECLTVHDGVTQVDLSRSAFYKYRDLVFSYDEAGNRHLVTLLLNLDHRQGVLSAVLNAIAGVQGNIVTINQGIPMSEAALATATIDLAGAALTVEELVQRLESIDGVRKADVVGFSK